MGQDESKVVAYFGARESEIQILAQVETSPEITFCAAEITGERSQEPSVVVETGEP